MLDESDVVRTPESGKEGEEVGTLPGQVGFGHGSFIVGF